MSLINSINNLIIKLATKYYKVVFIVIVILVLLICYFGFLSQKIADIRSYRISDYREKQIELEERQSYLASLKELNTHYNAWKEKDIEEIEKVLPPSEDFPGIFSQYEKLATDAGYTLRDIQIYRSVDKKTSEKVDASLTSSNVGVLNLQLGLEASSEYGYDNFITLLDTVEKNIRLTDVITLSFSPGKEQYRLNLKTYYLYP